MQKGLKTRLLAYEILLYLKKKNCNLDKALDLYFNKHQLSLSDKKMINAIVITSMRYNLHINKIISKYIIKKIKIREFIFFLSAITQIIYLDFKEYAVVNSTVELSKNKKIKIYPGFVNAVLKKIIKNKLNLQKIKISFSDFPLWFVNESKNLKIEEKKAFLDAVTTKPNLHLVFKKKITKNFIEKKIIKTSEKSIILLEKEKVENLPDYDKGEWWVQDFSTMLPILFTKNIKKKTVVDLCAAPGGKSFQALSVESNVDLIEISPKRATILKKNLERLKFKNKIIIKNAIEIDNSKKYDYVLVDAPCTSVGTIRKNPEIFFRNSKPNIRYLIDIQEKLLNKARNIVNKNGVIIYMVCSFLQIETVLQINKFIAKNKNFTIEKFVLENKYNNLVNKKGYINIVPKKINTFTIDGFFAVKLINNA